MTRSGMAAILRAVLYSGCFLNSKEFSRVEASSTRRNKIVRKVAQDHRGLEGQTRHAFVCLFELRL